MLGSIGSGKRGGRGDGGGVVVGFGGDGMRSREGGSVIRFLLLCKKVEYRYFLLRFVLWYFCCTSVIFAPSWKGSNGSMEGVRPGSQGGLS